MNTCARCGQHIPEVYLCEICSLATVRALTFFAPIVADLRAKMTDLHSTPTDAERVDGTRDARLGADFNLAERADALYATVAEWARGWAIANNLPPAAPVERYGIENIVTKLPRDRAPYVSASRIASWLIANHNGDDEHPGIEQSPDAGKYAVEVITAITEEAEAIGYKPKPRRVLSRLCAVCDSPTLRHHWPINGTPRLNCTACGEVFPCGPKLTKAVLLER